MHFKLKLIMIIMIHNNYTGYNHYKDKKGLDI